MVHVSVKNLLRAEMKKNPECTAFVEPYLLKNVNMPEQLINQLVQQKLTSSDCRMNGWVLEGFPHT
jgi:adenylate kinase family enzyme